MKVSRAEVDAAITRVQHGESTLEDGNLLRAWVSGVWRLLETAWAESDNVIDDELADRLLSQSQAGE